MPRCAWACATRSCPGLLIGALRFGHLPTAVRAGRADAFGAVEQGQGRACASATPPARPAGPSCSRPRCGLPRPRHLHLLRHRQHQPDADGGDGPAPAGRGLRAPGTPLREALTARGGAPGGAITRQGGRSCRSARMVDERTLVNAMVALLATGGSTNHSLHLPAIARAAGIHLTWTGLGRAVRGACRCWPRSIPTARPT